MMASDALRVVAMAVLAVADGGGPGPCGACMIPVAVVLGAA